MAPPRLVSVVIPVRNERRHLPEQLQALARQTYAAPWEVIVVDDGSTDGSGAIARSFASVLPRLRLVELPRRRGINAARNAGVAAARGDVVAFCDADDVAVPQWLAELVAALRPGVDLVGGELDLVTLNGPVQRAWRRTAPWTARRLDNGFFEYVPGGNCAMRTALARELRWDDDFVFGASDAEFAWRAQRRGLRVALAPGAIIQLRFAENIRELARQYYAYGVGQPRLYRREREHGWPRTNTRDALREWARLATVDAADLLRSPQRRGWWVRCAARRVGRLVGSLRAGVLYL